MPAEKISAYLSHSYRAEDRKVNEFYWKLCWANGVTFAVDPESEPLSVAYLELMMKRSAAFVGIVTRRPEQETYQCSPFMVFEHWLALQAQKARLVFVESGVPKDFFPEGPGIMYFSRQMMPNIRSEAEARIRRLATRADGAASTLGHGLGKVGLLLGKDHQFNDAVHGLIRCMGFSPVELVIKDDDALRLAFQLDELDFIVHDTRSRPSPPWLMPYIGGRFIPVIKLRSRLPRDTKPVTAAWEIYDLLHTVAEAEELYVLYETLPELTAGLARHIERIREERVLFTSLKDGSRYFRSLGRRRDRVFISNAGSLNGFGRQLSAAFRRQNIAHFHYRYQNNIELATDWRGRLPDMVRGSQFFVPLITSDYWASQICVEEYDIAMEQKEAGKIQIMPYFMADVRPATVSGAKPREVPAQGRDLRELPTRDQIQQIVEDVDGKMTDASGEPRMAQDDAAGSVRAG